MLKNRVIPILLLSGDRLVKTVRFASQKYVGDPINAIRIFNEKEVDELILVDIEASRERREPNYRLIETVAGECFMPLAYGGGIATVDQARRIYSLGVEKICLQTALIDNIHLVSEIVSFSGAQSVVASIDVKKDWFGQLRAFSATRRKYVGKSWQTLITEVVKAGAGEIILTSVDRDGTMAGMDLALIREATRLVSVPIVAAGGVGNLSDIKNAIEAGASAVGIGSFFVFHGPHRAVLITYPNYHDLEALLGSIDIGGERQNARISREQPC